MSGFGNLEAAILGSLIGLLFAFVKGRSANGSNSETPKQ